MEEIPIYYLQKGHSLHLHFADGSERTFSPMALVSKSFADNLLAKQITVGGCCGKPSVTLHLFATEEQLNSGQRKWIE